MKNKEKPHRAWSVLVGCTLTLCSTSAILNNIGQFYKPLAVAFSTPEKTIGISDIALGRTFQILVAAIVVFAFSGKILEKYFKPTVYIASLLYSAHYFLLSRINSLTQLYIVQCIGGVALSVIQFVLVMTTINRWFYKRKGFAIGISTAGAGLSSIVFSSVTGNIIEHMGWRSGYVFFGIVTFVLGMSGALLIKKTPQLCGLKPYGWDEEAELLKASNVSKAAAEERPLFKRPELYLITLVTSSFSFLMTSTAHTATYATSIGYGIVASAYISSVGLAGNASVKLLIGTLRDKLGTTKAAIIEFALAATGYTLLLMNINVVTLYIGVFLVGSVMSTSTVIAPVVESDHFQGDDFVKVLPFISMIGNIIGAFANFFYGWVCDITGSYSIIFKICLVILAADTVIFLILNKIKNKAHN